jgi:hypothetical protein
MTLPRPRSGSIDPSCASDWPVNRTACVSIGNTSAAAKHAPDAATRCNSSRRAFTFVREPLGHFIAGWAEYTARNSGWKLPVGGHRNVTEEDAVVFLEGLIYQGHVPSKFSATHPLLHMAPMAGVRGQLFGWPEFVGRLESADEDFAAIFDGTPLAEKRLDPSSRVHQLSSSDAQGARRTMRQVLKRRPDLRHGLCTLIGPDYDWLECLGYERRRCWSGEAVDEAAQSMCTHSSACAARLEKLQQTIHGQVQ